MSDRCIQGLDSVPEAVRGCVLTIGNFDGVHVGHRHILTAARSLADRRGREVTAMTFDPPPGLVLRPTGVAMRITPALQRCDLLRQAGADRVVTADTTGDLLEMGPQEFIDRVIVAVFAPCCIVEGESFFFGSGRQGTIDLLRRAGAAGRFDVHVVEPMMTEIDGAPRWISSALIRELVAAGRVEDAGRYLTRPFTLYGPVVAGCGRGRALDYPTANLDPAGQIAPADGIYAGRADVCGRSFPAAISVGSNPTFGPGRRTVEAFLLNAEGDFYDETMALSFIARLRDQERFEDVSALKARIAQDVQRVREICG